MVRRLFVQGLSSDATESSVKKYFERFGNIYECVVPSPPRYSVIDSGPDEEEMEARSAIRHESIPEDELLDDELDVEQYNSEKHGSFESYMKKVGDGTAFSAGTKRACSGYAYVTFVDMDGYLRCTNSETHEIDGVKCTVETAKEDNEKLEVESKRLFVSYFPLDRLTSNELKTKFGLYGKITDVEFVRDSEGPLHFCIITFADSKSVDVILTKSIYIRDVLMFMRRAVLKESIKIAQQKKMEQSQVQRIQLPLNHTAYPTPLRPVTVFPHSPYSSSPSTNPLHDPSAAAGYAPLLPQQSEADPSSQYGYGPRKW
ncbi:hypothetical protein GCK72_010174 [Caenorhabditis remanei]|uniref:RRM domain-containing protein n=1 Tax=Caenorhabditis remanei TaxID=31234 RepID=A0A6A5H4H8_CAERE|nr:hypothetical protein GCK72_010174 [Caenorhabditis remanei]KAF1761915.1 hypothetical protein GCK72_010174 [Caenorhabditis remanei]